MIKREIGGSHSSEDDYAVLLGSYAMQICMNLHCVKTQNSIVSDKNEWLNRSE